MERYLTTDDHYADCDLCGERFYGEARRRYLIPFEIDGELIEACCTPPNYWHTEPTTKTR